MTRVAARFDLFTVKKEGVTMDAKISELAACACECLALPEFVDNWNRLRPKFQISVMPMNRTPIQAMVDRACQVPPVLWSEETRVEFFRFVEKCIRIPVLEKAIQELKLEPR